MVEAERVADDVRGALQALARAGARLIQGTPSGRVMLAGLARMIDPAWVTRPDGDEFVAMLEEAARAAREPLRFDDVQRVLRHAWGAEPSDELEELEEQPAAITPRAQVHRGRLDGEAVGVKVLRPGLPATVRQDLTLLEALAAPLAAAFPALDAGAVLAEVRERLLDELDLEHEATVQRQVHRALRRHPFLSVPAPVTRLCHENVLVSSWVEGVPFSQAPDPDQAAARLVAFVLGAAHWGLAYADPEPANIIVTPGGRLAIVDFGACAQIDAKRRAQAVAALAALFDGDEAAFAAHLAGLGWLPADRAPAALALIREVLGEPLGPGPSRLDAAAVLAARERVVARADRLLALLGSVRLAPDDLWPWRSVAQLLATIARVGAEADWVTVALEALQTGWG